MRVVPSHRVVAFVIPESEVLPALDMGRDVGERHPDPLVPRTDHEVLREKPHELAPGSPEAPRGVKPVDHESKRGGSGKAFGFRHETEIEGKEQLPGPRMAHHAKLGRPGLVQSKSQPGLRVPDGPHRVDRHRPGRAAPHRCHIRVFRPTFDHPGPTEVIAPGPALHFHRQGEEQHDRAVRPAKIRDPALDDQRLRVGADLGFEPEAQFRTLALGEAVHVGIRRHIPDEETARSVSGQLPAFDLYGNHPLPAHPQPQAVARGEFLQRLRRGQGRGVGPHRGPLEEETRRASDQFLDHEVIEPRPARMSPKEAVHGEDRTGFSGTINTSRRSQSCGTGEKFAVCPQSGVPSEY